MLEGARWKYMSSNSSGKPRCDLIVSYDNMTGNWRNACGTAISNWNSYSNNKVNITTDKFGVSNVDLMTYKTANSDWPYPVKLIAFTSVVDNSGRRYSGGLTVDSCTEEEFGDRIRYASVIFNPNFENAAGRPNVQKNLTKVIVHEIGHCINLGHHESTSTPSVMKTGWSDGMPWSNFDRPQKYDIDVLNSMYNKIYS